MQRFFKVTAFLSVLVLNSGCPDGKKDGPVSELPLRSGSLIEPTAAQYNDLRPSLSESGKRLVFVSGRETTTAADSLKAFKADWPEGQAPGTPARVTSADIGYEREARISPDGNWVVLTVQKDGKSDLWLRAFDGTTDAVRLTDDALDESEPTFSPDSALLAWISRDAVAGTSQAWGLAVADKATKKQLSGATDFVTELFWLAGTYQLAIGTQTDFISSATAVNTISFAAVADAQAAARTAWLSGQYIVADQPRSSGSTALYARKAVPIGTKLSPALSGGDAPRQNTVLSEPVFATLGGATTAFAAPPGFEVLNVGGVTADATAGFVVLRTFYRATSGAMTCDVLGGVYRYASGIAALAADASSSTLYVPRTTATEGAFEVAKDYCDMTRADASTGRADDKIVSVVANGAATKDKFRALYVTRFTQHFDETCTLKAGDPEIYALEVNGTTKTIAPVSSNRAPIVDTRDANGNPVCVL